jgi:hypothetical protein
MADRAYQDGFVNRDGGTPDNGLTHFWGYRSTAQVQPNELVYTALGSRSDFSQSSTFSAGPTHDRDLSALGFSAEFTLHQPHAKTELFQGWLTSVSYFGDDRDTSFSNFSGRQQRDDFRLEFSDRYDTTGLIIPLRDNYAGTFAGPGPKIENIPTSREQNAVLINSANASFSNSVSSSLELDTFSIAIGLTVGKRF